MEAKAAEIFTIVEQIARIGIYETDLTTGSWKGSANFIKIFGLEKKASYKVEEFQAIVHPDDLKDVMEYFTQCLRNKIDFNYEYRCLKCTGEVIFVMSRSKVYYSDDGVPLRVLGIKQDITERKLIEQRLSVLVDNNKRKNEVLSMVAHDLQTPFSQLEALASVLKSTISSDHDDLVLLQQEICQSAKKIIAELIEIAELEETTYSLKTVKTDINALLKRCVQRFELRAKEKQLDFKMNFSSNCDNYVNPDKFSRAIDNLISNAIKFTPEGKSIELTTELMDDKLRVLIRDEGIGIKSEHLPLLFNKFSRSTRRTGTKGEPSNGLGLSIVKNVIDLHKGTITVRSEESKGSTFIIELPRLSTACDTST